jgi:hypothetical protein
MRALVVLGIVSLLGASLLAPPPASANHTGTCQSQSTYRAFVGRTLSPIGSVTGVRSDIDVGSWGLCFGATANDFLYFWVGIGADNPGCQVSGSCIIQLGISTGGTWGSQYAWAFGGCNGTPASIQLLGSATTANHNFRIEKDALNVFHLFIDGGQLGVGISQSDNRVSCWAAGDRSAGWIMEKSDFGNGYADKTAKSKFRLLGFKVSAWSSVPEVNPCFGGDSNDYCTDSATGDFDGWTDNGGTSRATGLDDFVEFVSDPSSVGMPLP